MTRDHRPRILFVNHAGVLGGAELSLADIARHFRDHCTVVLFRDGPMRETLEADGVRVEIVAAAEAMQTARREGGAAQAIRAGAGLLAQARRLAPLTRQADVIYANTQKAFLVAAASAILLRKPIVWHLRDILTQDHFGRLNRHTVVQVARRAGARVIANSEATRQAFIDAGGRPEQVVTIHNGIDAAPFDVVPDADPAAVRDELGVGGDLLVGSFSRLAPWKGQHLLVEAIARCPGTRALLVGEPLFGEDAYAAEVRRRIDQFGVADRVHLLGFRRDIPTLMKACDAIAHTSTAPEPFGRVIVEGMLARRPVIASDAGGAREIIASPEQGVLIPPGDAAALAAAITRLRDDQDARQRLGLAGRVRAERDFSVAAAVASIDAEIRAAALRPRRGRRWGRSADSPIPATVASSATLPETLPGEGCTCADR